MTSHNSSIWRCFNRPEERTREQADGRRERREGRREEENEKEQKRGQSDSEAKPKHSLGHHGGKAVPFLCFFLYFPLKSGIGNFTVLFSPPSFFQIHLSLAWFIWAIWGLLASVCHWPVLATILLSSLNPAVPLISLQEASNPVSCFHSSLFSSSPNSLSSHTPPFQTRVFISCWWQTGCSCSDFHNPQKCRWKSPTMRERTHF